MRVTVVHDYLTQGGGAERVVQAWARGLRPESISTLVWNQTVVAAPEGVPVLTTALQRSTRLRRDPRVALPLLPAFAKRLPVPASSEVLLVSSSGFAHNIQSDLPKVVYWHTPARWLHAAEDYRLGLPLPIRAGLIALRPYLLRTDQRGLASTSVHLCNSHHVRSRLERSYGIEAEVVHPPVEPLPGPAVPPATPLPDRFFLTVGRQRGYKNTDLVLAAAERAGVDVVSVGGTPVITEHERSRHIGLGAVSDAELKWLYAHAEALVSASREDFGLTPLEANLEGTPALVAEAGGFLDTIVPGRNGTFFPAESVEGCAEQMRRFARDRFCPSACVSHARSNFSLETHLQKLRTAMARACAAASNDPTGRITASPEPTGQPLLRQPLASAPTAFSTTIH